MLIDFHTHCFPEKIAGKAIATLSNAAGGFINYSDGTADGLKKSMADGGVDKSVVLNISTNEHQQKSVNDFAAAINSENIIAFGSVYPFAKDVFEELERIKALGLKGVKFHPDYQRFSVDDERLKPIYKKISDLELITVFHAGYDYGFPPPYGGMPDKMLKALSWFDSPVVAAHWGGIDCGKEVLEKLCGTDIYFDTSFGYGCMPKYYALKILEKHGTDKILFGTDSPWHNADMELRFLNSLGLETYESEKIKSKNAEKLLNCY